MTSSTSTFADANILYSAALRDIVMELGLLGAIELHWSAEVHREWSTALLARRPDTSAANLTRLIAAMNRALPSALVSGYEKRIGDFQLPDPGDAHIAAAAAHCGASTIVTFNVKHFPIDALAPHGLVALHPDDFLTSLAVGKLPEL